MFAESLGACTAVYKQAALIVIGTGESAIGIPAYIVRSLQ